MLITKYIQAGIAGAHIEDQTFPPKAGPRRRCISITEMVGKLRAAMDAKQALDPDFVIMARCDLGGVPGASFEEMNPPRSKLRGITRKGIVCETPRFLTLFPLQGNPGASSEESPD